MTVSITNQKDAHVRCQTNGRRRNMNDCQCQTVFAIAKGLQSTALLILRGEKGVDCKPLAGEDGAKRALNSDEIFFLLNMLEIEGFIILWSYMNVNG